MPQLMPLMWIFSTLMVFLFLMMMVIVFGDLKTYEFFFKNSELNIDMKWLW